LQVRILLGPPLKTPQTRVSCSFGFVLPALLALEARVRHLCEVYTGRRRAICLMPWDCEFDPQK
jgi:hypothetical protein